MASRDPPRYLLLLPPVPSPPDHLTLKAAFGESISQVFKQVAPRSPGPPKGAILEIALACPHLVEQLETPRAVLYEQTQSSLASVYKLVCTIAAKDGINVEDADGIDVRVLLVAWSSDLVRKPGEEPHPFADFDIPYGPIVNLKSLAQSGRSWQTCFGLESETGEAMVQCFIDGKGRGQAVTRVKCGPVFDDESCRTSTNQSSTTNALSTSLHLHVAVGGTFDHIHIGHKLLLTMTVFAADTNSQSSAKGSTATIGITGDQLLKNKKHAEVLESWEDRYKSTMKFVDGILDFSPPAASGQRHVSVRDDPGPNGKSMDVSYPNDLVIKCTEIQDPFGPTITEEAISALIISAETRSGGKAVNDKRAEKGWKALDVFEVDVLDALDDSKDAKVKEGFESKLSSTAIREKLAKKRHSSL